MKEVKEVKEEMEEEGEDEKKICATNRRRVQQ